MEPDPLCPPAPLPGPAPATERLDLPAVAVFVLVAYAGAWLVAAPLWLSGRGLDTPGAPVVLTAMMFTPALATVVVTRWVRRPAAWASATGLRPPGSWRPTVRTGLLAWGATPVLVLAALALATAAGAYEPDLLHLSGLEESVQERTGQGLPAEVPPAVLAVVLVASTLLAPLLNGVFAAGEEVGWRGWLLPRLLPLGRRRALLVHGVVWGLWHAPVILLGYNYPGYAPATAVLLMTVFCVLLGTVLGELRLSTGTIWPAVVVHALVNGSAGLAGAFAAAGSRPDPAAGPLGWSGWVVLLAVIAVLAVRRRETWSPGGAPRIRGASR